jgi:pimeloyl-ACP methyl ester carboxylesterase
MPKVRVNDIDLYYEAGGQGEPLLFIHGLGSSCRDWREQLLFFSTSYHVVVYDVRGHGRSDKPAGPYSVPQFASDAAGLLRLLEIESAHIIGISMGGMIAFELAASYPQMVRSMVIVNTGPEMVPRTFQERMMILNRKLMVRLLNMRQIGEVLSRRIFPNPEHESLRWQFVERWAENDPRAYRRAMNGLIGWSVADKLGDIECPTLVVAADQDYTPVEVKREYVAKMPRAELVVIQDSHHATPVEHPEQFNAVVAAFLSLHRAR